MKRVLELYPICRAKFRPAGQTSRSLTARSVASSQSTSQTLASVASGQ